MSTSSVCSEDVGSTSAQTEHENTSRAAEILRSSLGLAIKKCISVKYRAFTDAYKDVHTANPAGLNKVYCQFINGLKEGIKEEIEGLCLEGNVMQLVSDLYKIKRENPGTGKAWRPSGQPREDLQAHLLPVKLEHKSTLESMLKQLQEENTALQQAVLARRRHLQDRMLKQQELQVDLLATPGSSYLHEIEQYMLNTK
ncbi:PREDICTED: uncharacterized protein LOC106813447 [Priapulus caudatus]|uniref:Uncharacterized protein LOC106813447 n=1 Tax=Priapulus caudatus TaxID=37621 RepID=A0ABM1ELJ4_PRICU|nr:PREDICTED: uncharacterized protein LOC106813447 [Priapulus caudatus]